MSFLTVEDVNSILLNHSYYPFWYPVKIDTGSDVDFTGLTFDFCGVQRTKWPGGNGYTIGVWPMNDLATGHCFAVDGNGNGLSVSYSMQYGIYVNSPTPDVTFYFLISNVQYRTGQSTAFEDRFSTDNVYVEEISPIVFFDGNDTDNFKIKLKYANGNPGAYYGIRVNGVSYTSNAQGVVNCQMDLSSVDELEISCGDFDDFHYPIFKCSEDLIVILDDTVDLIVGKVNNVPFRSNYNTGDVTVKCKYPVTVDWDNKLFKIDLTDKYDELNVKLQTVSDDLVTDYVFNCNYDYIESSAEFYTAIANKEEVLRLGTDITLNANVNITHDCLIIGNSNTLNFAGYHIMIKGIVKLNDLELTGTSWGIKQLTNSKLTVSDCEVTGFGGSSLGNFIRCDINLNNLENPTDFITEIDNTSFNLNGHAILHGGELTIDNCSLTGDGSEDYGYFVYQTDGSCLIRNSTFDIHSETISHDVKFLPCLVMCGENAMINGASHSDLQGKDTLPFFDLPFNNRATIDLTYKYDAIDDYISLSGDGCCHGVSGVDFVFKNNVLITRSM